MQKLMTNISPWNPLISTWLQLIQILSSAVDLLTKARCNSPARYLSDLCNFEFWILSETVSKVQRFKMYIIFSIFFFWLYHVASQGKSYWEVYCNLWGEKTRSIFEPRHMSRRLSWLHPLMSYQLWFPKSLFKQVSNHKSNVFANKTT